MVVALWLVASGASSADTGAMDVFRLINERLALMQDVALYKLRNAKPVEDKAREQVVIEKAKQRARQAGLDPASTQAFFGTQISAAKAVQYRYLADWTLVPQAPEREPRDLVEEVRPELIRLGEEIVLAISAFLKGGNRFSDEQLADFLTAINVPKLHRDEKKVLFQSIQQIELSAD